MEHGFSIKVFGHTLKYYRITHFRMTRLAFQKVFCTIPYGVKSSMRLAPKLVFLLSERKIFFVVHADRKEREKRFYHFTI